jgi:hypothetical protein
MNPIPTSSAAQMLEQRVTDLLRRWRTETALLSSSTQMTHHPAYQEIITLGEAALPYVFRDLEQTQDGHLAAALTAITGAHPVPEEQRGRIGEVARTWLRWARENGCQW